jgi:hypothetical protein
LAAPHPPVRLRAEEIAAVKRIVAEHFGADAEVRVFGSRARLDQRGGDLDLHVRVPGGTAGPTRPAASTRSRWRPACCCDPAGPTRAVALAARLADSLSRSQARLAAMFPVSGPAVAAFDEAARTEADAFLKRFENLADHRLSQAYPDEPARQADQLNVAWSDAELAAAAATEAWAAARGFTPTASP